MSILRFAKIATIAGCAALLVVSSAVYRLPTADAQDSETFVKLLANARDFRVRAQAAFALGDSGSSEALAPLVRGLKDRHAVVRAAAATALGRLGNADAVQALREAQSDSSEVVRSQAETSLGRLSGGTSSGGSFGGPLSGFDPEGRAARVPWPNVRYVVTLGEMANQSGFKGEGMARLFRTLVERQLRLVRGVAVLPDGSPLEGKAKQEIRRRRLPKIRIQGNLVRVDRSRDYRDIAVRCEVSLMLLDDAQQALKGMLRGAATGKDRKGLRPSIQEQQLAESALQAAVRSAVSGASQALARLASR